MIGRHVTCALLVMGLATFHGLGQVEAEARFTSSVSFAGGIVGVTVSLDPGESGTKIGSYGATLVWDPAQLEYLAADGAGQVPFNEPVVNSANAMNGVLGFGDAAAEGVEGPIDVLSAEFKVVAPPCVSVPLDLEFSSIYAAETFEDLSPVLTVRDATTDVVDVPFSLLAENPAATTLSWSSIEGATRYDVIRGFLEQVFMDTVFVNLGTVICVENDSLDTSTAAGTEPANPDLAIPLPGNSFFYLVRVQDSIAGHAYGFASRCTHERTVSTGDCP